MLACSLFVLCSQGASAQVLTGEDSLNAGLVAKDKASVFSGYGEVKATYDTQLETAKASVTRAVLFFGHRFNESISLFSEVELENAQISGDDSGGELSLEQLFIKFNLNKDHYLTAGLFLPRIGIINENHLPTTFYGNDRPFTEQEVIPATWREIGVSINGIIAAVPGLNYSAALMNGLNSAAFTNGTGIREGRYSGKDASMSNLALNASLLYYTGDFRFQVSGYYGGSAGLTQREADSLQLDNSPFGTPVGLVEANVKYSGQLFSFAALASFITIPEAYEINKAYANNTPEAITGSYVEAGVNLMRLIRTTSTKSFSYFVRYEMMDLNKEIPENGIINEANEKTYFVTGLEYKPVHGVVIKADYVFRKTGEQNPDLIINPYPQAQPYYTENGFINIGLGYSF
jgi:hypothetical protein